MPPLRLLITAGPTHEPIDAVRYIANRSSGRMGIALAESSVEHGHATTLLLGPTHLRPADHSLLKVHRFQSTADLQGLLADHWPRSDVLIMAAAVADYRVAESAAASSYKIKRGGPITLQLVPTPDLLAELAKSTRSDQFVIGFALEPRERLLTSARDKLTRKNLDAIVANPLETMDSPSIEGRLLLRDGKDLWPEAALSKNEFARWLIDQVERLAIARVTTRTEK